MKWALGTIWLVFPSGCRGRAEECADRDGDGFSAAECGGPDCDDTLAVANPQAPDNERIGTWVTEVVDEGFAGSLAFDAAGQLHAAYGGEKGVRYATRTEDGWEVESVGVESFVHSVSLLLDADGAPQIAYGTSSELRFARRDTDGWAIEVVASESGGFRVSLAMCPDGSVQIAYVSGDQGRLATNRMGTWEVEDIGSDEINSDDVSMAVDAKCVAHVSYSVEEDFFDSQLRYATKRAGVWTAETVSEDAGDEAGALAIDSAGSVHIAYFDGTDTRYAVQTSTGWSHETVAALEMLGEDCMLALDGAGEPHVVWFEFLLCLSGECEYGEQIRHAVRSGSEWTVEPIETPAIIGWLPLPSFVVDGDGADHLLYSDPYDLTNGPLYYASNRVAADGIDQNCDGVDGVDRDGDGFASVATFGQDCDDEDPDVSPSATDEPGDGIDRDCDGVDG